MVFDTRNLIEQQRNLDPFPFIGGDGETYRLPNLKNITPRQLARFRDIQDPAEFSAMVRDLAPGDPAADAAAEAIEQLPLGVIPELFTEWAQTAGTPGKSPSPSTGTKRAGKRRKPTSRSAASTSKN